MAPFGGALFWGQAAQSHDESRREWERLWQMEQERLSREQMQEDQQRFDLDLELKRQSFEERMAEAERNFQLGLVDRNEQFLLGQEALERMGGMNIDQQWATVEWLERSGNPVSSLARQMVRSSLFQNPQEAIDLVNNVFTAPLGTRFNPTFVNMAIDAVSGMAGWDDDTTEQVRKDALARIEQLGSDAEELDDAAMEGSRLALQQARADIVQTGAETGNILAGTEQVRAQTAAIYQGMDIAEEQRGIHLQILERTLADMDATIRIKGLEATAQEIMNGFLPSQLSAGLAETLARTQGMEDQHLLFQRTLDYTVREMAARTGLAEEDLRFALATSLTREAIVRGDHELLMANIDVLRAQEENIRANTSLTGTQQEALELGMDETRLRMNESRISMLSQLTAAGDVELLTLGGAQLLRDMGFDDVTAARVLEQLTEVASTKRSNALKVEEANVILALEEANFARDTAEDRRAIVAAERSNAEFQAETNRERLDFEQWATREGFRIDWAYVDVARSEAASRATAATAGGGAGTPLTPAEILNEVRIASGIDLKEFNDLQSEMENATNDLRYFEGLLNNGSVEEISDYLTSIGVSPENHAEYLASLQARQQSAARAYAGAISTYLSYGASYGPAGVFTPQQLGITTELGREMYRQVAESAVPGLRQETPEEQSAESEEQRARIAEVYDAVYEMNSVLSRETSDGGLSSIVGAEVMFQRLMAEFGPERLQEAGITSPERLYNDLGNKAVEYSRNVESAMLGINFATGGNPQQVDARSPEALNQVASIVNATAGQYAAFKATLDALPRSQGLGFLIGGSNSPERGDAARQLVAMTAGVISPQELWHRGIIQLDSAGNVMDFLHIDGAKRLMDELSADMYQSAASIRWLAANGGIR